MRKGLLMKRSGVIFLIAVLLLLPCLKARAADNLSDELKLYLGETQILPVNNPTRIAIGNPDIVDVTNATKSELTLSPKLQGSTTLVIWDNFGEQSYSVKVFNENIHEIKRRVDNLLAKLSLPGIYTQAEEDEGKVILLGSVKIPQDRENITLVLGPLKEKTVDLIAVKEEDAAVEIDVQVLELSKDATNTLGLTWPGSITLTEVGSPGIQTAGVKWSTLLKVLNLKRAAFSVTLDALVQEGKAKILSRPRLACQSGKEAELLVGGEKPIITTTVASTGGSGTNVEYKEYGLKLKIKPTVTDDQRIKVSLNVEISEVGTAETIGEADAPTARAYPLTKRNVLTELYLGSGQTMAIGGLIKQKAEEDIRKIAGLGDLPIVGLLFRKKDSKIGGGEGERGNMELFITLTPTIIPGKEAVSEKRGEIKPAVISSSVDNNLPVPLRDYASIVQKRIMDNLRYPDSAKEAGFSGTVKLKLHLSYLGQLLDVAVKEPSSYRVLDDNAIEIARRLISYPPFPPSVEEKELWIDIPITYQLD